MLLATCVMMVSCLAYSSALKMKVTCSSETQIDFQLLTPRYTPEDQSCGNLKSYEASVPFIAAWWSYPQLLKSLIAI
jgi:hypothetical protein